MKFCCNMSFTLPKQSQKSRSILKDGSRFLGLFWKEKTVLSLKKYGTLIKNILFQTINTVAEVIRGNLQNQEYFASVMAPSNPPR